MTRRFDHLDLRVRSMAAARPFYEQLLPALGFTIDDSDDQWLQCMSGDRATASEFFGVIESPTHQPNENRVAFWAESIAEVDRLAALLQPLGAAHIEGPDYEDPHYYAVYFEDPSGNRLEICHRTKNKP